MSDKDKKGMEDPPSAVKAALSPHLDDIAEALDVLYITGNPSGRHRFREKWPDLASYLFCEELTRIDFEGTQDLERRAALEEEANLRRLRLKVTVADIPVKSVDSGALIFDFVGGVIDEYGPKLSQWLYSENVVERVRPGVMKQVHDDDDKAQDAKALEEDNATKAQIKKTEDARLSKDEKEILSNKDASAPDASSGDHFDESMFDDVKPINTDVSKKKKDRRSELQDMVQDFKGDSLKQRIDDSDAPADPVSNPPAVAEGEAAIEEAKPAAAVSVDMGKTEDVSVSVGVDDTPRADVVQNYAAGDQADDDKSAVLEPPPLDAAQSAIEDSPIPEEAQSLSAPEDVKPRGGVADDTMDDSPEDEVDDFFADEGSEKKDIHVEQSDGEGISPDLKAPSVEDQYIPDDGAKDAVSEQVKERPAPRLEDLDKHLDAIESHANEDEAPPVMDDGDTGAQASSSVQDDDISGDGAASAVPDSPPPQIGEQSPEDILAAVMGGVDQGGNVDDKQKTKSLPEPEGGDTEEKPSVFSAPVEENIIEAGHYKAMFNTLSSVMHES